MKLRQYRRVDGNVDAQYSVSHFKAFPASWRKHTKQQNQLLKVDVSFAIP